MPEQPDERPRKNPFRIYWDHGLPGLWRRMDESTQAAVLFIAVIAITLAIFFA